MLPGQSGLEPGQLDIEYAGFQFCKAGGYINGIDSVEGIVQTAVCVLIIQAAAVFLAYDSVKMKED